ncbi:MAG: lytic transglycosylase domain-containing protein, partial [Pseudomonadota bacterium]
MKALIATFLVLTLYLAMGAGISLANEANRFKATEQETFDNEPPIVKTMLEQASVLLADEDNIDAAWQAANFYCEAARYGSAEGMYRLGMLYAFGRGVPASRDYAANLFGIASAHGHYEAQKMLETIEIKTTDTPS